MPACDVAIIGAGPAGLAAADALAGRNLDVCLFDENPRPGGQLLRSVQGGPPAGEKLSLDLARRRGRRLLQAARKGIRVATGGQVLGIFPPDRLLVQHGDGRVVEMTARCTICATGARERFIPFPGWTLPGVIATGAAQILLKGAAVLPGKRIVVAGTGPLPLLLAHQILTHGGRVAMLVDGADMKTRLGMLRLLPRQTLRLIRGGWLMTRLIAAGVPIRSGQRVVAAAGRSRLESVTTARLDNQGATVPGSLRTIAADALAAGFGFVPNIELPLQAGCAVRNDGRLGGWVVETDENLATSVPGLFAAGEVTGIGGGDKSLVEGRLCGLAVLEHLGKKTPRWRAQRRKLIAARHAEMAFGRMLGRISRIPPAWVGEIPDETIVCRCEDVRMGDVRRRLADGFATAEALKRATRCGMGNCQGRICGPIIADILAVAATDRHYRQRPPSTRCPVKTVSLGALAGMRRTRPQDE